MKTSYNSPVGRRYRLSLLLLSASLLAFAACSTIETDPTTDNAGSETTEVTKGRELGAEETALLVTVPDGPVTMSELDGDTVQHRVVVDADGNTEYQWGEGHLRKVDGVWYLKPDELSGTDPGQWVQLRVSDDSWLMRTLLPGGAGWRDVASDILNTELWWPAYCLTTQNVSTATKTENGWEYDCSTETDELQVSRGVIEVNTDRQGRIVRIEGPSIVTFDYEPETVQVPKEYLSGSKADAWLMDVIAEMRTPEVMEKLVEHVDRFAAHVLRSGADTDTELLARAWELYETFPSNELEHSASMDETGITIEFKVHGSAVFCQVTFTFEDSKPVRGEPVCEDRF